MPKYIESICETRCCGYEKPLYLIRSFIATVLWYRLSLIAATLGDWHHTRYFVYKRGTFISFQATRHLLYHNASRPPLRRPRFEEENVTFGSIKDYGVSWMYICYCTYIIISWLRPFRCHTGFAIQKWLYIRNDTRASSSSGGLI